MPKHGSIILYVHGNQKARYDGQLRTSTSTLTQLLNLDGAGQHSYSTIIKMAASEECEVMCPSHVTNISRHTKKKKEKKRRKK